MLAQATALAMVMPARLEFQAVRAEREVPVIDDDAELCCE
jgi:hypothetical protein